MAEKKNILTYKGLRKLEDELQNLKVNVRKEVATALAEARAQGDLSENAEYDAARERQRDVEARIEEIESLLKTVEVIDEDEVDLQKVSVGCEVSVYDMTEDEEVSYYIVGSSEANILENKISNEAPIGVALIGSQIGDVVTVEAPDGEYQYKVLDIKRVN